MDASMLNHGSISNLLFMIGIVGARIGTALAIFPMFALTTLPAGVRATIVVGLSLCLLPSFGLADLRGFGHLDGFTLAMLLAKEVMLGFGIGLVGSAGFWAIHAAGAIIESQAGLSGASAVDPLSGEEDSLLGGFLVHVVSLLFIVSGGLLSLLGVLYESFRVWPLAELTPRLDPSLWLDAGQQVVGVVTELAVRVAAPFVLAMLMVEVSLGLLGRYAPQFSVFFLALPLKAALLVGLLFVYAVVLADGSMLPDAAEGIRRLLAQAR